MSPQQLAAPGGRFRPSGAFLRSHICRTVASGCLLAAAITFGAEAPDDLLKEFKIPLWEEDIGLRSGFGYKDNVLLSHNNPKGSFFWQGGIEGLAYRLPTHGWLFNFFLNGEHVQYLDPVSVENEQFLLAAAQVAKDLGKQWKTGLALNYIYQNQVFDVTATETNQSTIGQVQGHTLLERWMLRKDFNHNWAEVEMSASRQWLASPLDNYWQLGPKLTLGRIFKPNSDLSLSYQWLRVAYDTRTQLTKSGVPTPNSSLVFYPQSVELAFRYAWDQKKRWQTVTKIGLELNQDNDDGFFDYYYYRVAQQLKYRAPTWELSGGVRAGYYDYPVQTIAFDSDIKRHRAVLAFSLHAEKQLAKHWKVYANFSHDRSFSNLQFDDYAANVVNAGIEFRF